MTRGSPDNGRSCPRCRAANRGVARFCARCGLVLDGAAGGGAPGRVRHPQPLPQPAGSRACANAVDLFFAMESAWGGKPILATEGLAVTLHNCGYPLEQAVIRVAGFGPAGGRTFQVEHSPGELPRGMPVRVEIPSYELPDDRIAHIEVTLVSAAFAPES